MGRPCKPRAKKQSENVVLRLTPSEKKRLDAAAERAGLPVATFARIRAMQAT
jgi:uncharacterized protein (DUF1778 family)